MGGAGTSVSALPAILDRPVHDMLVGDALAHLGGVKVLVTGAAGSVGTEFVPMLEDAGCRVTPTDHDDLDVTDREEITRVLGQIRPEVIFHLAGAKHAPQGEEDPWTALQVNAVGTANLLNEVSPNTCRVVTASTCKACNPETAYGASKLLAERITLNAGHSVARFYNVVETDGNVFDIWGAIPDGDPILWTDCQRYFLSLGEALGLLVWTAVLEPGRFVVDPGFIRWMRDVAKAVYPTRELLEIERRRGDREHEVLRGTHETMGAVPQNPWLLKVRSPHD